MLLGEVFAEWTEPERKKLGKVSSIVLVIGLAVSLAALVATNEYFNGTIASLNAQAAKLNDKAGQAELDAANARKETVQLGKDTQGLKAEADKQRALAASALQKAGEANETAERERLARLKIEERLAWRKISKQQHDDAVRILLPFAGSSVIVDFAGNEDPESRIFAEDVVGILKDAHWSVHEWRGGIVMPSPIGIDCTFDRNNPAAAPLVKVLSGLPGGATTRPAESLGEGLVAAMHIGVKPIP